MLPTDAGRILPSIARAAIMEALGGAAAMPEHVPAWLQEKGACFVTLHRMSELRGCIGTLVAYRPLIDDVRANAVAASCDRRFEPLTRKEVKQTDIEVSLLGPLQPIPFTDERDALAKLQVGIDGVALYWHGYHGTFLPQVWERVADPAKFLAHLKDKAGLPDDFWADDMQLYRYTVSKWTEADSRGA